MQQLRNQKNTNTNTDNSVNQENANATSSHALLERAYSALGSLACALNLVLPQGLQPLNTHRLARAYLDLFGARCGPLIISDTCKTHYKQRHMTEGSMERFATSDVEIVAKWMQTVWTECRTKARVRFDSEHWNRLVLTYAFDDGEVVIGHCRGNSVGN